MTETVNAPVGSPRRSRWRTTPQRLLRLLCGLWLFGTGEALLVDAALGNAPWTVFAQGVSLHTPLSIGVATVVIGAVLLCAWLPLRERPGIGTVANVVVVGLALDVMRLVLPAPSGLGWRATAVLAGIALVGVGSGLYLGADLGPGPRDGVMTGLRRRFGWPLAGVRAGIELTVLALGVVLGGTAGLGTLAFAMLVGPAVGLGVRWLPPRGSTPESVAPGGPPTPTPTRAPARPPARRRAGGPS